MKLLASDYDGTFKSDVKNLKINIQVIKDFMDKGNKFAIITGRSFKSIKKEIEKYNIEYHYLSCNNGLIIFDKDDNIVEASTLPKETLKLLYNIADESLNVNRIKLYDFYDSTRNLDNVLEVALEFNNIKSAKEYKKYLQGILSDVSCYQVLNRLFIGNNQSKANAVEIIKHLEQINDKNIYTVGDNLNDLDMLQKYNGYRIGTSYPKLWFKRIPVTREVHTLIKKINKK